MTPKHKALEKILSKEELLKKSKARWAKEHPGRNREEVINKTRETISKVKSKPEPTQEEKSAFQKRTGRGYNE